MVHISFMDNTSEQIKYLSFEVCSDLQKSDLAEVITTILHVSNLRNSFIIGSPQVLDPDDHDVYFVVTIDEHKLESSVNEEWFNSFAHAVVSVLLFTTKFSDIPF